MWDQLNNFIEPLDRVNDIISMKFNLLASVTIDLNVEYIL